MLFFRTWAAVMNCAGVAADGLLTLSWIHCSNSSKRVNGSPSALSNSRRAEATLLEDLSKERPIQNPIKGGATFTKGKPKKLQKSQCPQMHLEL
eukprot:scaffold934_cov32-Prasinocladus_malaysianus.AAC.2